MTDERELDAPRTAGISLQMPVPLGAMNDARDFYRRLFGRDPDFSPHDDFLEWAPIRDQECWFQVVGQEDAEPLINRVRFRVTDMREAIRFLDAIGLVHSEPSQLPGVVAFVDFSDPWGNRLGYYEDLVPSGQQEEYRGTSVHDASQFAGFSER